MVTTWVQDSEELGSKAAEELIDEIEHPDTYVPKIVKVSEGTWNDITHFEGNANAFRLLAHRFKGRRDGGFVMTYSTLASIVKYPFESALAGDHGKFGFFCTEKEIYQKIAGELGIIRHSPSGAPLAYARHPLVYLVEAADDICYEIMDIEDSHKLKILSFEQTKDLLLGFFDESVKNSIEKRIKDEGITDDNDVKMDIII